MLDSRRVTSRELTEQSIARLKRYSPKLLCTVTMLERRALAKADEADRRIAEGRPRGPLDGVPCGIKDLFALRGHPTTWGAEPFRDQVLEHDAAVVERLDQAGAVIVAKLTLGALAMDDKWFGGMTRNPWNPKQGSSGSSAGSASAMAARLVAFTVGTETLGSIVSPSQRCRVTGLRPTFGRISRHGAMALSWTMDKVGPICRSAEDCAIVLEALHGADPRDPMSVTRAFVPRSLDSLHGLRVAYLSAKPLDEDDSGGALEPVLESMRSLGADPKPVRFREIPKGTDELLACEAAAAFQQITLDGRVDTISRSYWPQIFRTAHLMSGVDYVQAMRARTIVMRQFEEDFGEFDLLVAPDRGGFTLYNTNLTGHPQVYVPDGKGSGFSLVGRLYGEATLCAVAQRLQDVEKAYLRKPDLAAVEAFDPAG
jgi:Asp-tRNA(Asn)/Glu-tRNA(Gln) amidotransferase A subunit family amidase